MLNTLASKDGLDADVVFLRLGHLDFPRLVETGLLRESFGAVMIPRQIWKRKTREQEEAVDLSICCQKGTPPPES